MRVLLLWADDRSTNLGVRVLGAGTAALARQVWPDADITFYNYGTRTAPVRLGSPLHFARGLMTHRTELRDWFRSFDLVLDTRAGDSFTDIYGARRLFAMCAVTAYAHRVGVPVVLSPQTIGPFGRRRTLPLPRKSLSDAALVMARDSESAAAAANLGRPVDVLTTDVVFALDVPQPAGERDVVLNISGLLWQRSPHVDWQAYRRTVAEVYDALTAAGRTVSLLAHVIHSDLTPDNDVPAVLEFRHEHCPDAEVLLPEDLDDVRSMLAGARLAMGSRMHSCLNALSVGTPAIPLAYSRKFAPLLDDLGWPHVVDLRTEVDVAARVTEIAARDDLPALTAKVRERAGVTLRAAADALAGLSGVPAR